MSTLCAWATFAEGVTPGVLDILAQRDIVLWQTHRPIDPATGTAPWDEVHAWNAEVKARNPHTLTGIYAWGMANPQGTSPAWPWINDAKVLHRVSDGAGIAFADGEGQPPTRLLHLGDQNVRTFLVDQWLAWMAEHSYDVLVFDYWWPQGLAGQTLRLAGPAGVLEGDALDSMWWCDALSTYTEQLRWALESVGKLLIVNGISIQTFPPDDPATAFVGPDYINGLDYASGMLAEHVHRMYVDQPIFDRTLAMLKRAVAKNRRVLFSAQPESFHATDADDPRLGGQNDWPRGDAVTKFYLATYKLIEDPMTILNYHDGAAYWGFGGGGYGDYTPYVWDSPLLDQLDIGYPIEEAQTDSAGIYWRRFSRGQVVVNAGSAAAIAQIAREGRAWGNPHPGALLGPGSVEVPAHSGVVLHDA